MAFHYCDQFLDAAPGHRCLCTRRQRHRGACACLCGHLWGDSWSRMTYDQQRAFLGLTHNYAPLHALWGAETPTWTIEIGEAS